MGWVRIWSFGALRMQADHQYDARLREDGVGLAGPTAVDMLPPARDVRGFHTNHVLHAVYPQLLIPVLLQM
eukprot:3997204-Amphidinium_carterae.4